MVTKGTCSTSWLLLVISTIGPVISGGTNMKTTQWVAFDFNDSTVHLLVWLEVWCYGAKCCIHHLKAHTLNTHCVPITFNLQQVLNLPLGFTKAVNVFLLCGILYQKWVQIYVFNVPNATENLNAEEKLLSLGIQAVESNISTDKTTVCDLVEPFISQHCEQALCISKKGDAKR